MKKQTKKHKNPVYDCILSVACSILVPCGYHYHRSDGQVREPKVELTPEKCKKNKAAQPQQVHHPPKCQGRSRPWDQCTLMAWEDYPTKIIFKAIMLICTSFRCLSYPALSLDATTRLLLLLPHPAVKHAVLAFV